MYYEVQLVNFQFTVPLFGIMNEQLCIMGTLLSRIVCGGMAEDAVKILPFQRLRNYSMYSR